MVESNHDEERLARIEAMLEALQRENEALKVVTAKMIQVVETRLAVNLPEHRRATRRA
jgi:methionine synthase II (cobalamin-independent)